MPAVSAALGPVDVLVHNAAAAIYAPLATMPLKRRQITFEVNVHAAIDLAQAVLPAMRAKRAGWIVNLSSASSTHPAGPPYRGGGESTTITLYGASKAALERVTTGLAAEVWADGIAVNSIAPVAAVRTPGAEALVGRLMAEHPELVEPVEWLAEAVLALATCDARTCTGRVLYSGPFLDEIGRKPARRGFALMDARVTRRRRPWPDRSSRPRTACCATSASSRSVRLPLRVDAGRLAGELARLPEDAWRQPERDPVVHAFVDSFFVIGHPRGATPLPPEDRPALAQLPYLRTCCASSFPRRRRARSCSACAPAACCRSTPTPGATSAARCGCRCWSTPTACSASSATVRGTRWTPATCGRSTTCGRTALSTPAAARASTWSPTSCRQRTWSRCCAPANEAARCTTTRARAAIEGATRAHYRRNRWRSLRYELAKRWRRRGAHGAAAQDAT